MLHIVVSDCGLLSIVILYYRCKMQLFALCEMLCESYHMSTLLSENGFDATVLSEEVLFSAWQRILAQLGMRRQFVSL